MLIVAKQLKETKDEFGKDKCIVTVIKLSSAISVRGKRKDKRC